jgi:hypothetical protein
MRSSTKYAAAAHVREVRERREKQWNVEKYGLPFLYQKEREFPSDGKSPMAPNVGWKLLEAARRRIIVRNAAFIRKVLALRLSPKDAKTFLHWVLKWTFDKRKSRFPKKSAEEALSMIQEYSVGELPNNEVKSWVKRCTYLPDYLNGPVTLPIRISSNGGHNRSSYKNMIFQTGLYYLAQYDEHPELATEMSILACTVNVRTFDPINDLSQRLRKVIS